MSHALKGVVFDHSTLLVEPRREKLLSALGGLLRQLRSCGLKVAVLSTHPKDIDAELGARGLPDVDLFLSRSDVGANKGSPRWLRAAALGLGVETHELAYVGDDRLDWVSAINAATFYMHALWSKRQPPKTTAYVARKPAEVYTTASHFLLPPPRWGRSLDIEGERSIHVRSLLGANVRLAASPPRSSFRLQDVFSYEREVKVGSQDARDLLMFHALSSLYVEGLVHPNPFFAVYPSSTPGASSEKLGGFLRPAAKLFHGFYKEDLIVRAAPATDTSMERHRAWREGRRARVSFANQTDTVHLNPDYADQLAEGDRTVFVFDDFTTTGMSLEWARNLLYAAGVGQVVLLTVGKYPKPHTVYAPVRDVTVSPFELRTYPPESFRAMDVPMPPRPSAEAIVQRSFEAIKEGLGFPVETL